MSDIAGILSLVGAATSSIVSATEAGKNLKQLFRRPEVDVAASKELVLELLDKLIDAKEAQMQIQDLVLALQGELKQRDQFEAELARYTLSDTGRGAAVYRLKSDDDRGEPAHSICPRCVAKGEKSILQPSLDRHHCLYCPSCKAEFLTMDGEDPTILVAPGRSTRWDAF